MSRWDGGRKFGAQRDLANECVAVFDLYISEQYNHSPSQPLEHLPLLQLYLQWASSVMPANAALQIAQVSYLTIVHIIVIRCHMVLVQHFHGISFCLVSIKVFWLTIL